VSQQPSPPRLQSSPAKANCHPQEDGFPLPDSGSQDVGLARFHRYIESFADSSNDLRRRRYPSLTSLAWHDPAQFSIVPALEKEYEGIRREILALRRADFQREGEKIDRSGSWDVFFFYELGRKNVDNCAKCPLTTDIIEGHNTIRTLAGLSYFSKMSPGTHVAPHRGPTNMRLRCHLGLQVPDGDCAIRVGGETRTWQEGKCLVFDDHFTHEVWNNTSEPRIVLVVDLWHPDLSACEISLLQGMHRYVNAYSRHLHRYWRSNAEARAVARIEFD
jgi:aspartyl/asparaginyl beta-hydroxylase (cupin superfamily)